MAVRALRHRRNQKRRLFAGRLETAYLREERLRRLAEGKKVRKRRLFAGRNQVAYARELAVLRLESGKGRERRSLSHRLKGEFGGFDRDPSIRRD